MSTSPAVEIAHLAYRYGDREAIHDLSLSIAEREIFAILGPNGSGKTTLFRVLSTLIPIQQGEVRILGHNLRTDAAAIRSQLGIVSSALHHHFVNGNSEGSISGEAAVLSSFLNSYGILRYGHVSEEMRRRTAEALAAAGALHLAGRMLDEMSSGEARRVLLARAFATAPRALILDEPTTGLDMVARHAFMESVRSLARAGTTLVLITHHVEEIVPEISRVILLREGRIAADGARKAVLTEAHLSQLFGRPIVIEESGGYQYARPE